MRPVERGGVPQVNVPTGTGTLSQDKIFNEYVFARSDLIFRIGDYCSYCERRLTSDLAVEHVEPKRGAGAQPHLALIWTNFLLGCRNCNSAKGDSPINLQEYFWPHLDNTFRAFLYSSGGLVTVNTFELNSRLVRIAVQTMELTNFPGRINSGPTANDRRLECRRLAWDVAQESFDDLRRHDTPGMRHQIERTALAHGYFSVWMTVFDSDSEMKRRFIDAFRGTAQSCFDEVGNPVPRPGGQI